MLINYTGGSVGFESMWGQPTGDLLASLQKLLELCTYMGPLGDPEATPLWLQKLFILEETFRTLLSGSHIWLSSMDPWNHRSHWLSLRLSLTSQCGLIALVTSLSALLYCETRTCYWFTSGCLDTSYHIIEDDVWDLAGEFPDEGEMSPSAFLMNWKAALKIHTSQVCHH